MHYRRNLQLQIISASGVTARVGLRASSGAAPSSAEPTSDCTSFSPPKGQERLQTRRSLRALFRLVVVVGVLGLLVTTKAGTVDHEHSESFETPVYSTYETLPTVGSAVRGTQGTNPLADEILDLLSRVSVRRVPVGIPFDGLGCSTETSSFVERAETQQWNLKIPDRLPRPLTSIRPQARRTERPPSVSNADIFLALLLPIFGFALVGTVLFLGAVLSFTGSPKQNQKTTNTKDSGVGENTQKDVGTCGAGPVQNIVREQDGGNGTDLFPDPPPMPNHSHEYEGHAKEWKKRQDIRSHRKTYKEHTELAKQQNQLHDELISLSHKRYDMNRIRARAALEDRKLQGDFLQVELDNIEKTEKIDRRKSTAALRRESELLEVGLKLSKFRAEIAKQELKNKVELAQLQKQLDEVEGTPAIAGKTEAPGDKVRDEIRQEIDRICKEIDTITGLQQACREMKERSPAHLHPLIDRLFLKVIDTRKERL